MSATFIPIIRRCEILSILENGWIAGTELIDEISRRRKLNAAQSLLPEAIAAQLVELGKQGLIEVEEVRDLSQDPAARVAFPDLTTPGVSGESTPVSPGPLASRRFRLTELGRIVTTELCDSYEGCCG